MSAQSHCLKLKNFAVKNAIAVKKHAIGDFNLFWSYPIFPDFFVPNILPKIVGQSALSYMNKNWLKGQIQISFIIKHNSWGICQTWCHSVHIPIKKIQYAPKLNTNNASLTPSKNLQFLFRPKKLQLIRGCGRYEFECCIHEEMTTLKICL